MAKGQASGEELTSALRSVGTLSSLARPGTARRDSPFAGVAAEPVPAPQPPAKPEPPAPAPRPAPAAPQRVVAPVEPEAQRQPAREARRKRLREFTDEVTVPMTAEMRTRASLLAADLQRRRTDRTERLTANSVFRVAIETFLERFTAKDFAKASTEEQLLALATKVLRSVDADRD